MATIYRADTGRLTVAEAKQLMIDALPDDLPGYASFRGEMNSAGEVDWDIDNPTHATFREASKFRLDNQFPDLCKSLGFEPHLSIDPTANGYRLREDDDRDYMITHAQFVKLADKYSLSVEIGDAPEQADPKPQAGTVEAAPMKAGQGWSLKTSIARAPGYRWPLYQTLKAAHIAGQPCPKARDVLEIWKKNPPLEVQVMPEGVKYNDGLGNAKEANLRAMGQAIKNLLSS